MTDNRTAPEKAWSIVLGFVNDRLDAKLNTVEGCRQAIREAELQLSDLRAGLATTNGTIASFERRIGDANVKKAQKDSDFALLAGRGKLDAAKALSAEIDGLATQITALEKGKSDLEGRRDKMQQVVDALDTQLKDANARLQELEIAEDTAEQATEAVNAIERAGAAKDQLGSLNTGGVREQILHRQDVADAHFDAAVDSLLGSSNSPGDVAASLRADDAFAERMRAMGLNADGTPVADSARQDATAG